MAFLNEPVLNIIVVGFHHKKGCQAFVNMVSTTKLNIGLALTCTERFLTTDFHPWASIIKLIELCQYNEDILKNEMQSTLYITEHKSMVEHCYPELVPGRPTELPPTWRHLPALALPDGSHNYLSDTIFFNLPGLTDPAHTVYGISCFRQIPVEQVVQKTEDMTRSSVQKSVCVVCRAPLFGRLAVKMELVVRAWFLQGDFSQTKLLEDAYKHLNSCPVQTDQTLEGLPVQRLVENWRHKALLLFKLLLLRRKVLIYGSPAGPLSAAVLTLVSLLPQCLDQGLSRAANVILTRPLSPIPATVDDKNGDVANSGDEPDKEKLVNGITQEEELSPKESENLLDEKDRVSGQSLDEAVLSDVVDRQELTAGREKCHSIGEKYKTQKPMSEAQQSPTMARDMSVDGLYNLTGQIDHAECGFPLPLFEDGYLCLPYLSLNYLDLLSDPAVQGFVVGASNVLFKQKRQLFDVLVELNEMRIETADLSLKRQLVLGTEDLRFADHVVRHGATQGDAWIRDQFASYLIYLLRTSLLPEGSREIDSYNAQFMATFKCTPAYEQWMKNTNNGEIESFMNLLPVHPFSGQLSVSDMKLKFAHTMSTTEGGRKVTAAVASTGRAVATTSRAVGGALSQARGALSGWWSALTAPPPNSGNSDTSSIGEDKLQASDAEDIVEQIEDDNKIQHEYSTTPTPDPPDKTIDDSATNISKITVV